MMRSLAAIVAAFVLQMAAPASAWTVRSDKGLNLYEAAGQGVSLSVVCDPDGVWEPGENHVEVTVAGAKPSGDYVVSAGGADAAVRLDYGMATGEDRAKIVQVLHASKDVSVSFGGMTYQLDTGAPFEVSCGA